MRFKAGLRAFDLILYEKEEEWIHRIQGYIFTYLSANQNAITVILTPMPAEKALLAFISIALNRKLNIMPML
jgi:hypothetical protein